MNLNITGVAGVAVPRAEAAAGNLTCTEISAFRFPLAADCKLALDKVKPVEPTFCTEVFKTEYDYVTVGTCTIHTYSTTRGKAHCLDGKNIIKGVKEILKSCRFDFGEATGKYTGGQYEWSTRIDTDGKKGEGVRLVGAPIA